MHADLEDPRLQILEHGAAAALHRTSETAEIRLANAALRLQIMLIRPDAVQRPQLLTSHARSTSIAVVPSAHALMHKV